MSDNDTSKAEGESEEEVKPEAAAPEQVELKLEAETPEVQAAAEEVAAEAPEVQAASEAIAAEVAVEDTSVSEPVEMKEEAKVEKAKQEAASEKPGVKVETGISVGQPAGEVAAEKEAASEVVSSDSPDLVKKAEAKLREFEKDENEELIEKVVFINRCAKVVKGGRRFSFSALVVCGDQKGKVGYGFGKANEVADCIRKGSDMSKKAMVAVSLKDNTIPHEVIGEFGGGRVMLRPASPGTGIIAGGGVRAVVEAAGIKDVLAKSMGSNNHANVVKATLKALMSLRTREQIYKLRGKRVKEKAAL